MAKKITSKAAPTPAKKASAPKKKAPAVKSKPKAAIEQVCIAALTKLRELNLDLELQGEIEWCLGSYANDGNPAGLYVMAERALQAFSSITVSQPKAVPAKLMSDLKKAMKERPN